VSTPTREAWVQGTIPWQPGTADMESVLPELRAAEAAGPRDPLPVADVVHRPRIVTDQIKAEGCS
jgi:hypothetical protein